MKTLKRFNRKNLDDPEKVDDKLCKAIKNDVPKRVYQNLKTKNIKV